MKTGSLLLLCSLLLAGGAGMAAADTASEVESTIRENFHYMKETLTNRPDNYSREGAIEFWSSGGLMQDIGPHGSLSEFDLWDIEPKHIVVIPLVEGQAAVAHFYMEGVLKAKGFEAVTDYKTRVTQVFVNENGTWKIRAAHWSPLVGGSGTQRTFLQD